MGRAVPVWLVIGVVLGRDLWILLLSAVAFLFTRFRNLKPSIWGKPSTFAQIMAAVAVMAARAYNYNGFAVIGRMADRRRSDSGRAERGDYRWRGI